MTTSNDEHEPSDNGAGGDSDPQSTWVQGRMSDRRLQSICLMVLTAVASTYMVYWLRPVLVPFVVACFVVSGVAPILNALESRLAVSRLVAAGLTFLIGMVILAAFGITIWLSLVDLTANSDAYRRRVVQLATRLAEELPIDLLPKQRASPTINGVPQARPPTDFVDEFVRTGIATISQAFIGLVSTSMVVLIYVFFLLLGNPTNTHANSTIREIDSQIRNYLSLKTVISICTGLAFGLTLRIFGVPMAVSFGVLAFLLNFIPNVGPIVASLLPIPLIIFAPDGTLLWMIAVISITVAIQVVSGNLIEPRIMGKSSDLHPVAILLALMFWGTLWGIVGMFLATPITAAAKLIMERFEPTRAMADALAGRWSDDSQQTELV